MNNTEKLLRAFIEAQGYEVETTNRKCGTDERVYDTHTDSTDLFTTDYKVTKKVSTQYTRKDLPDNYKEIK